MSRQAFRQLLEMRTKQIKKSEINNNLYYLQNDGVKNQINKECLKHKLTPTYAEIKIKDTNKAATKTKEQSQTLRIKRIKISPNKEK